MSRPKAERVSLLIDLPRGTAGTANLTVELARGSGIQSDKKFAVIRAMRLVDGEWTPRTSMAVFPPELRAVAAALVDAADRLEAEPPRRKIPDEIVLAAAVTLARLGGCTCKPWVRRRPDG